MVMITGSLICAVMIRKAFKDSKRSKDLELVDLDPIEKLMMIIVKKA